VIGNLLNFPKVLTMILRYHVQPTSSITRVSHGIRTKS
jgi:hypothetical protein